MQGLPARPGWGLGTPPEERGRAPPGKDVRRNRSQGRRRRRPLYSKDRRRDGGGNRRGSRRALSRRRLGDRHPLWGLSDANGPRRIGEREREPVRPTTSTKAGLQGDDLHCTPRTARPRYDPLLLRPKHSPGGPYVWLVHQPTRRTLAYRSAPVKATDT